MTSEDDNQENQEFRVLLNGARDLEIQLEEFKKSCDEHEKGKRKRCKRRYYQLGLMAKIVNDTTDEELKRLLKNGTRTFLVDAVTNKPQELDEILMRTDRAIMEFQEEDLKTKIVTGLALEVHGDCLRIGRMRNNCPVMLLKDDIMTLTTDPSYKYSCFKEISYVINLNYYIMKLELKDVIKFGKEVRGRVVKKLKGNIAVMMEEAGLISSYDYIEIPNQCFVLKPENLPSLFAEDLNLAIRAKANYIVMPNIRCKPFLKILRASMKPEYNLKIIGTIDFGYVSSKMCDLMGIIKLLDYLWIPNFFQEPCSIQNYIYEDVIPISKCLKTPVIGSVPLERCSDFKRFENHDFLWKIDTIFIEKSSWCNKYPLIVKKLLPIKDFRIGVVENVMTLKSIISSYESIINFIIRTISSIECQAIIIHCKCETAAAALGRVEIYCPVLVMLPIDEENEQELTCKLNLVRALNLRRNLRSIMYTNDMNECDFKPVEFGVEYARRNGILETGDFIITLEICKEDEENVEYGIDGDVAILRAYYLPPLKFTEKFKYC